MLYKLCVLALAATASGFSAPVASRATSVRAAPATMQMTDFSWRSTFNGKPPGEFSDGPWTPSAVGKVVPTAAPTGEMTVAEACTFMAATPEATFAEKKAFLESKGVSAFVIAEAACAASDTTLVL